MIIRIDKYDKEYHLGRKELTVLFIAFSLPFFGYMFVFGVPNFFPANNVMDINCSNTGQVLKNQSTIDYCLYLNYVNKSLSSHSFDVSVQQKSSIRIEHNKYNEHISNEMVDKIE